MKNDSRSKGCLAVLVTTFVVLLIITTALLLRGQHTGILVDGKELSPAELETGRKEIHAMVEGKLTNFDGSIPTNSPISAEFKQIYVDMLADLQARSELRDDDVFLNIEPGTRQPDEARQRVADYDIACLQFLDRSILNFQKHQLIIVKVDGKERPEMVKSIQRLELNKKDYLAMQRARETMVDFVFTQRKNQQKHPPNPKDRDELSVGAKKRFSELYEAFNVALMKLRNDGTSL